MSAMSSMRYMRRDPVNAIQADACPLSDDRDFDRILAWIGDARVVLLGESTHGTLDFYAARATLTRRLIAERGFSAVAIEGDWPDAYQVNRYVQGRATGSSPTAVLQGFARFPTWMWRNTTLVDFVGWLHRHNLGCADPVRRVGFYGLDLYSLHASMRAVVAFLERHDPASAQAARRAYACFDHFGDDTELYAWAASKNGDRTCEEAVTRQLTALRERRRQFLDGEDASMRDDFFSAEQNARLARNAERYYRTMFHGRVESWNVRDRHMGETLDELVQHLTTHGKPAKVVVWAHNSHVGDARATQLGDQGELNLGQLARERYGADARLIGFSTYSGTVIAASDWGGRAETKRVRPALAGSYEDLFHETGIGRFFLPLDGDGPVRKALAVRRLERAIGVIYRPDTERMSHYFEASLSQQFDAVIHFDETQAVEPLEHEQAWDESEVPETYPSGV